MMKLYYVYIVQCADKSYYTGITNNLERRISEHNDGDNPKSYTFKRRPVVLKYYSEFNDVHPAIVFEKQVKGWSRAKKEAIIEDRWEDFPLLSKNKQG